MTASNGAAHAAPFFDPWAYLPDGAALRDACETQDARTALAVLRTLTTPDALAALWLVGGHADKPTDTARDAFTAAIEAADDGSALARTLRGLRYVTVGWGFRSRARAEHVSRDQFEQFHDWLRRAERTLFDVCSEFPDFVPAWEIRITICRGLELGHSEARRRYDRLAALDPHVFSAQEAYLQQILPKWSGSWEQASQFVADCTGSAPPGSLSHLLVLDLAVERWLDGEKTVPPEMVEQVRQAAARSVWHPEHVPVQATAVAHANLAQFFSLADHPADAKPHFDHLGEVPVEGNFQYYGDPAGTYRKLRAAAEKAGAGRGRRA